MRREKLINNSPKNATFAPSIPREGNFFVNILWCFGNFFGRL